MQGFYLLQSCMPLCRSFFLSWKLATREQTSGCRSMELYWHTSRYASLSAQEFRTRFLKPPWVKVGPPLLPLSRGLLGHIAQCNRICSFTKDLRHSFDLRGSSFSFEDACLKDMYAKLTALFCTCRWHSHQQMTKCTFLTIYFVTGDASMSQVAGDLDDQQTRLEQKNASVIQQDAALIELLSQDAAGLSHHQVQDSTTRPGIFLSRIFKLC